MTTSPSRRDFTKLAVVAPILPSVLLPTVKPNMLTPRGVPLLKKWFRKKYCCGEEHIIPDAWMIRVSKRHPDWTSTLDITDFDNGVEIEYNFGTMSDMSHIRGHLMNNLYRLSDIKILSLNIPTIEYCDGKQRIDLSLLSIHYSGAGYNT